MWSPLCQRRQRGSVAQSPGASRFRIERRVTMAAVTRRAWSAREIERPVRCTTAIATVSNGTIPRSPSRRVSFRARETSASPPQPDWVFEGPHQLRAIGFTAGGINVATPNAALTLSRPSHLRSDRPSRVAAQFRRMTFWADEYARVAAQIVGVRFGDVILGSCEPMG